MPVSTSPEPAVARTGEPVRLTRACPSGAAISVRLPFSSATAPARLARRADVADRSASRSRGFTPVSRPNSPTCGVSTTSEWRSAIACASPVYAFSPSASSTTGTGERATSARIAPAVSAFVVRPGPIASASASARRSSTCSTARRRDGAVGRGRQTDEDRLDEAGLHDRQDLGRHGDDHQPGADAAGGLGHQPRRAGHPARAGHDHQHARGPLVRVGLAPGQDGGHVGRLGEEQVGLHEIVGEPDVDDAQLRRPARRRAAGARRSSPRRR